MMDTEKNGKDIEEEVMEEGSKKQRKIVGRMTDGSSIVEIDDTKKNETEQEEKKEMTDITCPNCGLAKMWLTKTKRTFAWKCPKCSFDTNRPSDLSMHRRRELEILPIIKKMFPQLIFKENVPIDTDILSGEKGRAKVRYDCGVYWFNKKVAKLKISVLQNTSREHYLNADEQYIQGQKKVFEYLAKIGAIMVFYFVDEPDETKKIAMADCKEMLKFSTMVKDRFGNDQHHLSKDIRKIIIKTTFQDFKPLIFRKFYDLITEGIYVV
jgi:predicted RNA-binding Zn-ribbon protein involved in translation (DUF1610 family)